ncbi:MAG: 2'-5' RNA ligase family protein [Acidobacteriota bacterium]
MECGPDGSNPINCYALVAYIPGPLGEFLDQLRVELVPACVPKAHVTVLPPRSLAGTVDDALAELNGALTDLLPFRMEARSVEMFHDTSVIYIGLGAGWSELQRIHDRLNRGPLAFEEPFPYHPHITLAQEIGSGEVSEIFERARRRWEEYQGPRTVAVETITFVQNTDKNRWLDLAHWSLRAVPAVR